MALSEDPAGKRGGKGPSAQPLTEPGHLLSSHSIPVHIGRFAKACAAECLAFGQLACQRPALTVEAMLPADGGPMQLSPQLWSASVYKQQEYTACGELLEQVRPSVLQKMWLSEFICRGMRARILHELLDNAHTDCAGLAAEFMHVCVFMRLHAVQVRLTSLSHHVTQPQHSPASTALLSSSVSEDWLPPPGARCQANMRPGGEPDASTTASCSAAGWEGGHVQQQQQQCALGQGLLLPALTGVQAQSSAPCGPAAAYLLTLSYTQECACWVCRSSDLPVTVLQLEDAVLSGQLCGMALVWHTAHNDMLVTATHVLVDAAYRGVLALRLPYAPAHPAPCLSTASGAAHTHVHTSQACPESMPSASPWPQAEAGLHVPQTPPLAAASCGPTTPTTSQDSGCEPAVRQEGQGHAPLKDVVCQGLGQTASLMRRGHAEGGALTLPLMESWLTQWLRAKAKHQRQQEEERLRLQEIQEQQELQRQQQQEEERQRKQMQEEAQRQQQEEEQRRRKLVQEQEEPAWRQQQEEQAWWQQQQQWQQPQVVALPRTEQEPASIKDVVCQGLKKAASKEILSLMWRGHTVGGTPGLMESWLTQWLRAKAQNQWQQEEEEQQQQIQEQEEEQRQQQQEEQRRRKQMQEQEEQAWRQQQELQQQRQQPQAAVLQAEQAAVASLSAGSPGLSPLALVPPGPDEAGSMPQHALDPDLQAELRLFSQAYGLDSLGPGASPEASCATSPLHVLLQTLLSNAAQLAPYMVSEPSPPGGSQLGVLRGLPPCELQLGNSVGPAVSPGPSGTGAIHRGAGAATGAGTATCRGVCAATGSATGAGTHRGAVALTGSSVLEHAVNATASRRALRRPPPAGPPVSASLCSLPSLQQPSSQPTSPSPPLHLPTMRAAGTALAPGRTRQLRPALSQMASSSRTGHAQAQPASSTSLRGADQVPEKLGKRRRQQQEEPQRQPQPQTRQAQQQQQQPAQRQERRQQKQEPQRQPQPPQQQTRQAQQQQQQPSQRQERRQQQQQQEQQQQEPQPQQRQTRQAQQQQQQPAQRQEQRQQQEEPQRQPQPPQQQMRQMRQQPSQRQERRQERQEQQQQEPQRQPQRQTRQAQQQLQQPAQQQERRQQQQEQLQQEPQRQPQPQQRQARQAQQQHQQPAQQQERRQQEQLQQESQRQPQPQQRQAQQQQQQPAQQQERRQQEQQQQEPQRQAQPEQRQTRQAQQLQQQPSQQQQALPPTATPAAAASEPTRHQPTQALQPTCARLLACRDVRLHQQRRQVGAMGPGGPAQAAADGVIPMRVELGPTCLARSRGCVSTEEREPPRQDLSSRQVLKVRS